MWCYRVLIHCWIESVTTIAGVPDKEGFKDGDCSTALFNEPHGLAFDNEANLLVADANNNRIRLINLKTSTVSTLVGNGEQKSVDGPALQCSLCLPMFLAPDAAGNLFISGLEAVHKY